MSCLLTVPLLRGSFAPTLTAPLAQTAVRCSHLASSPQDRSWQRVSRARRCLCLGLPVRPCSGSVRRGSTSSTYDTPWASSAYRPVSTGERLQRSRSYQAPARVAVVPITFVCHPFVDCLTHPLFVSSVFARFAGVEAAMVKRKRSGRHRNADTGVGRVVWLGITPALVLVEVGTVVAWQRLPTQGYDPRFHKVDWSGPADPRVDGTCDVQPLGGGERLRDVPPGHAVPFRAWVPRVWRAHADAARRSILLGCEAEGRRLGTTPEAIWLQCWEKHDGDGGAAPAYPHYVSSVRQTTPITSLSRRRTYFSQ